jgi:16S rRNA pseudouridine516 synthase
MEMDVLMMRLDKYLTETGVGTRSEVKKYIRQKLVTVDGVCVAKPEFKLDETTAVVCVNGKTVCYAEFEYYMLNKPAGYVSAVTDPRDRTVVELITDAKRKDLFPAGRLDKDTEGLLLITNDGALAHRILSPTKHVDKTYFVRVTGKLSESLVHIFAEGIDIGEDGGKKKPARPAKLRILSKGVSTGNSEGFSEAELTICEGRFHQVKRMFHAVGHEVVYLKRISMGGLKLDETLRPGEYRPLTTAELEQLEKSPSEIKN